jgi:hypothetical protein
VGRNVSNHRWNALRVHRQTTRDRAKAPARNDVDNDNKHHNDNEHDTQSHDNYIDKSSNFDNCITTWSKFVLASFSATRNNRTSKYIYHFVHVNSTVANDETKEASCHYVNQSDHCSSLDHARCDDLATHAGSHHAPAAGPDSPTSRADHLSFRLEAFAAGELTN